MEEQYKKVCYSKTTVSELMIPAYANFGGKIHGGIILSPMDKVAYACVRHPNKKIDLHPLIEFNCR